VKLPAGKKAVWSKWVYTPERYKARLVAQGFTQKFGSNYDETFCSVVRQESLRVVVALSMQCGLKLHQVDVTTAFPQSLPLQLQARIVLVLAQGWSSTQQRSTLR
jgi:hypothetical protein